MPSTPELIQTGAGHIQAGRPDLALAPMQAAYAQQPANPEVNRLLGLSLFQMGQTQQGLAHMQRAASLAGDRADIQYILGSMLAVLGQLDRAIPVLQHAAELDPRHAPARGLLATCFLQLKDLDAAELYYREAVALDPRYPEARSNLGSVLQATGRPQEALEVLRAAAADHPAHVGIQTAYCVSLNYADGVDPAEALAAHAHYGRVLMALPGQPKADWPNERNPAKKLRIAVVSPDLFEHSVAYFLRPLLEHRDRAAVEYVVYSCGPMRDAMTERLMGAADLWRDGSRLPDPKLLETIRADQPDILIELSGHTQGSKLSVLRLRGAPVQATYIGYPNTTGVPTIDARLVDAITDPPGEADRLATERLIRLPGCFLCYSPPDPSPPVAPPPREANGFITFGSFNSIKKLTPGTIALWASVLHAVPRSRLVIKSGGLSARSARGHLAAALKQAGIPEVRFEIHDKFPAKADHLAAYAAVDIALDTFPYNGTTTTCEAMWMGVPVVTLAGGVHASRVGLSLLTAAGVPDLAAATPEQFRDTAAGLAGDAVRLRELRSGLRARLAASPLCDAPSFARGFEAALRALWTGYCGS
ncbi:MAG: tetratricopeptide repeat protein [Phycisphaerales bacterium]